jgi:hypothetical protein
MKNFFVCCSIALWCCKLSAQEIPYINQHPKDKPALFASLPDTLSVTISDLQQLFTRSIGSRFAAAISKQFIVDGWVMERKTISPQQQNINIKLRNYDEALLNIAQIKLNDESITYTAKAISPNHGDMLILTKENNKYYFVRQQQSTTVAE